MTYPLTTARAIAEKIIADITPYCVRCDIAGSVRREKPLVKDIEIVCIPKFAEVPGPVDLFGEKMLAENILQKHLEAKTTVRWIKPGTSVIEDWPLKPQAKYWRGLMPNGIKLDIFLARPENWGMIYLLRTGSFEFNIALATHAKRLRRPIRDGRIWVDRVARDTPEEQDVFNWLGLAWVEPRDRINELSLIKSEYAKKGGLHLVNAIAEKPPADWNAIARASPFVLAQPAPEPEPLIGEMVDPRSGEIFPVRIEEQTHFMCLVQFTAGVPDGWHRRGWQSRKWLLGAEAHTE